MPSGLSTPAEHTELVADFLREFTFRSQDEDALQRGVAEALEPFAFTRELRLDGRSRIDFVVHGEWNVGIEVKIKQAAPEVARQVRRYLKSEMIDGLVLVTTRRRHRALETEEFDKPVRVVWLGRSGL